MTHNFSEDELVYGDSFGLVHRGVLEDKEIERMKALRDKVYGKSGIAVTTMKPIGRVEIEGKVYEARLENGYLDVRTPITVVGIDFGYLLVEELKMEAK